MIDKRKAYEEKLAAQLEEWTAQVALFKAKSEKAAAAFVQHFDVIDFTQLDPHLLQGLVNRFLAGLCTRFYGPHE